MIDTGFQWTHPYFAASGYDVHATADSEADPNGHGTGESANLLALAPRITLHGLSMADPVESLAVARDDLQVQLISNSWGTAFDTDGPDGHWDQYWAVLQREIALCAHKGIVVLFSAGNGGISFTASMPETISVGGAYIDEQGDLMASNYASSFDSFRFRGEHVPEICGLTGLRPRAMYVALPVPEGCEIDREYGGPYPPDDGTAKDDGWAVFSGTSAACPGIVALILGKYAGISTSEIKDRLHRATDVVSGVSAMGDAAGPGWDKATGFGLVNALEAMR